MWLKKCLAWIRLYLEHLDPPALKLSRAFLCLWALSFYLNYAESWSQPEITFISLGLCLGTLFIKNLRIAWAFYLLISTSILLFKFPILANHSIFNLFVNLYLLIQLVKNKITKLEAPLIRSILVSLIVVYFMAGIHKINSDYIFHLESCAHSFMDRINRTYFGGSLPMELTTHASVPIVTVLLEIAIAFFLFFRRTFYIGLICAVSFHMVLAALEFIDFSMNSLSILVMALGGLSVSDKSIFKKFLVVVPFYVVAQLFSGLISYFEHERGRGTVGYHFQTFFFVTFSLWVLYYGVKLSYKHRNAKELKIPRRSYLFPTLVFIFASFNYLGLSTAGTFSMFSNLRTEGDVWNHLFIPKFLRVFPYQDNIYWIHNIDRNSSRPNREHPRINQGSPEIEFYRVVEWWKENGQEPKFLEYELNGERQRIIDVLGQDIFKGRSYSWLEQKLLFFRRVQQDQTPNRCRW